MQSIPKLYWITTISFGLAALSSMTSLGQGVQIFFLVSIIGMPVAFFMSILPTIALYLAFGLPALWLTGLLQTSGLVRWLLAIALAFLMGVVPAQLANYRLAQRTGALLADDRAGTAPFDINAPVLWRSDGSNQEGPQCDKLCLHLLLFAGVERVFVLSGPASDGIPAPETWVPVYWFEDGSDCASYLLFDPEPDLAIPPGLQLASTATSDQLVQAEIDKGRCLRSDRAQLSEADSILLSEARADGADFKTPPFSINADTLSSSRMSLFQRDGANFVVTVRKTFVASYRHPLGLMPITTLPIIGSGEEGRLTYYRTLMSSGTTGDAESRPTFVEFLVRDIGLRL
jgi:hypothetical protein